MIIDLGVMNSTKIEIDSICRMAHKLGISGIATPNQFEAPMKTLEQIRIYKRTDIKGRGLSSIRRQIDNTRKNSTILALEIGKIETINWAVDDKRIDLLTLTPSGDNPLRPTTATLAKEARIALEVHIAPLLQTSGFNRSKILKIYREAIGTAMDNDMMVVLTSGATAPIELRSPVAMVHIGILLGMEKQFAERAIDEFPSGIIQNNLEKMDSGYITTGVRVLKENNSK